MAGDTGTRGRKGNPAPSAARRARGFAPAASLIARQVTTLGARRGFAKARLAALWSEIAGPELAAITRPEKLALARGPAGGLLSIAVSGAHAPKVQMMLPLLRERVNAALGPGAVGRIQLVQAAIAPSPASAPAPAAEVAVPDLAPLRAPLSRIGDDALRAALETLAGNVLSRAVKSRQSGI